MVPTVSIVGKSGSGKTVLMEQLIAEFKRRGYRVAALKHSRGGLDIDRPGKDSWRFAQAGSDAVLVSTPGKLVYIKNSDHDLNIEEIMPILDEEFDLVLVEGFKKSRIPKIEVHRKDLGNDLLFSPEDLSAIVTDGEFATDVTQFSWGNAVGVADFIEENFVSKTRARPGRRGRNDVGLSPEPRGLDGEKCLP
jgi:molybdopterin-guanine dinucleotide biosynthesis protein MobB